MKLVLRNSLVIGIVTAIIAVLLCGFCAADEPELPDDVFAPPEQSWTPIEPVTDDPWLDFIVAHDGINHLRGWWPDTAPRILLASLSSFPLQLGGVEAADQGDAYEQALPSVVFLQTTDENWDASFGTGAIVDAKRGYILTAYHVARPGRLVMAYPQLKDANGDIISDPSKLIAEAARTNATLRCVPIARYAEKDLALLKILNPKPGLRQIPIAVKSPRPGQSLFTIGNSVGGPLWRFASGNVRQVFERTCDYPEGQKVRARFVETTVPTNPGDSGGPLIDRAGNLVGVNSSYVTNVNQVHHGVDVAEVRDFLGEVGRLVAKREQAAKAGS